MVSAVLAAGVAASLVAVLTVNGSAAVATIGTLLKGDRLTALQADMTTDRQCGEAPAVQQMDGRRVIIDRCRSLAIVHDPVGATTVARRIVTQ